MEYEITIGTVLKLKQTAFVTIFDRDSTKVEKKLRKGRLFTFTGLRNDRIMLETRDRFKCYITREDLRYFDLNTVELETKVISKYRY